MNAAPTTLTLQEAIAGRHYDAALSALKARLRDEPQTLLDAKDWSKFFTPYDWFEAEGESERYLQYATDLITAVADRAEGLSDQALGKNLATAFIYGTHFRFTAHSSGDPRPLMRGRARLFGRALSDSPIPRTHTFATAVAGKRPRLGVLFKHLRQDPETTSMLPFFEEAKAQGIEVVLFVGSDAIDQKLLQYVSPRCDQVYRLPDDLGQAILQIRQCNLDIVFFGNDITAKPSSFAFLSFFRLARLGAFCVSTISTTASPAMDVYFGSPYHLKFGFDKHFDERFIALPDPSYAFSYPLGRVQTGIQVTRAQVGVSDETPLFISGANQTKLHKPLIAAWARILHRSPGARLLLYPFPPHYGAARQDIATRVIAHFAEFGIAENRVIITDGLPRDAVISLLGQGDLGLDSFPYTGATTLVDAVEAGLPTVSLKGGALRTSHGAAILHAAGFDDLVVDTVDDYVDLAVRLMENRPLRMALKARFVEANRAIPPFLRPKDFSIAVAQIYHKLHGELAEGRAPVREGRI